MASSLTSNGITWEFDKEITPGGLGGTYQYGQYCNGDYWIVGPVTILSKSPAWNGSYNGAELNCIPDGAYQGINTANYGSYAPSGYQGTYDSSRNVGITTNFPLTVGAGSSLLSASGPGGSGVLQADRTKNDHMAVLTVVSSPPASGSFRPGYAGTSKTIPGNEANLRYDRLDRITPASGVPSISAKAALWRWCRPSHLSQWVQPVLSASGDGTHGYGVHNCNDLSTSILLANCDYSAEEKRDLVVNLCQFGIDLYSVHQSKTSSSGLWLPNGGHGYGQKAAIMFAGALLDHAGMLAVGTTSGDYIYESGGTVNNPNPGHNYFPEDGQTFYVKQEDVDRGVGFSSGDIGEPWWSHRHTSDPTIDGNNIPYGSDGYVHAVPTVYGFLLSFSAMSSIGLNYRNMWNHDVIWDNADKYYAAYPDGQQYTDGWAYDMWVNYKAGYTSDPTDTTPPLAPTSLVSNTQTDTTISLSWTASGQAADGDYAVGYTIYRDSVEIASTTNTYYLDEGLTASTSYAYEVYAYDDANNESSSAATGTFSTSAPTTTTTIFINGSGDSSNGGTSWSDALRYLPSTLARGTTYYIGSGDFGRYTFDDAANTTKITIKKATLSDHGTDTGWANAFADRAYWGNLTFSSTSHIDFLGRDTTVISHNGSAPELGTSYILSSSNILIQYCDIDGMNGGTGNMTDSCMRIENSSYIWVEHNRIHNCADDIIHTRTVDHCYWRWNRLYDSYGIDYASTAGNGHSDAFELWACTDCEIIGNFVYNLRNTSNAAIFTNNYNVDSNGGWCYDLLIANNIFYMNTGSIWYTVYLAYTSRVQMYNNILWGWYGENTNNAAGLALEYDNNNLDLRNNVLNGIFTPNGGYWDYNTNTGGYNWIWGNYDSNNVLQAHVSGYPVQSTDIIGRDPKFTGITTTNNSSPTIASFAPANETAPTIDAGTAIAEVSYDILRNPRPGESVAYDIGAFEYTGVISTGACCNQATGECTITSEYDCPYTWLGAGSTCDDCLIDIPTDGILLSYPCDETTGYITADASGNGSDGYLVNAAADFTGGSTQFNEGTIQFIDALDGVEFQSPNMEYSRGTVSASFYPTVVTGLTGDRTIANRYIFGHAYDAWSNTIQLYITDGYLQLGMGDNHFLAQNVHPVSVDTWYHVALTWQDSGVTITDGVASGTPTGSGSYSLYVDGVLISTGAYSGLNQLRPDTYGYMARFGNTGLEEAPVASEAFEGYMDNMRLYNLPLSADEASVVAYIDGKDTTPPAPDISPPVVTNGTASSITATSVVLSGEVTATGGENPEVSIYYGTTDGGTVAASWDSSITVGVRSGTFNMSIGDLTDNTTYYFRCYATNSGGYDWANSTATFDTLTVSAPTITQNDASFVGVTDATVSGTVTDDGNDEPVIKVYYGLTDEGVTAGNWDSFSNVPLSTDGTFSKEITGLTADTTYYFRFAAENSGGTTWGDATKTFDTNPTGAPTVTNNSASEIGSTYATIGGEVTDVGLENPSVTIYWGKNNGGTEAANWDNTATFGVETGTFSTTLTGLDNKSLYYFRAYATNSYGSDWANSSQSFTTLETEPISPDPNDKDDGFIWGWYDNSYEITSPYLEEEVFDVHKVSRADVVFMAHKNHWPRKLIRYGDKNWAIEKIDFTGGPFLDENIDDSKTCQYINGTGGTTGNYYDTGNTGTLSASGHTPFKEVMVGSLWLLRHTRADNKVSSSDNNTHATPTGNGIRVKGDWHFDCSNMSAGTPNYTTKIWRKQGDGNWQEYEHFSIATLTSGTEEQDDVFYTWTASNSAVEGVFTAQNQVNYGIVKITSFSSTSSVSVEVVDPVYQESGTSDATSMWAEGAWNGYRGYPESVTFYGNRLWWGSTTNNPQGIWGSKVGYYEDHTKGVADDAAIVIGISDNDVSSIEWISASQSFMVGTAKKEYVISASDRKDPITPSDKFARPHSAYGSMSIQPVEVEGGMLYAQRLGYKMLVLSYEYLDDAYDSADTNRLASHMFKYKPVDISRQGSPETVIWVTREDGTLCCFRFNKDEEIAAWSRVTTGDIIDSPTHAFISTTVIAGATEDRIWTIVSRIVDGETRYYIERFSNRNFTSLSEGMYLDCAKTETTNSNGTLKRLSYLEGHEVTIMQGATEVTSETITNGEIRGLLPDTEYTIGLKYLARLRTMPFALPGVVTEGYIKRILRVLTRTVETKGGVVGAESHGQENKVDLDIPYSLESADLELFGEGGFTKESKLVLEFNDPYPAKVLALVYDVEIS